MPHSSNKNYHPLEHIPDGMESIFYSFLESNLYNHIQDGYYDKLTMLGTKVPYKTCDLLGVQYTEDNDKIIILRKDLFLLLIGQDIYQVTKNLSYTQILVKEINEVYFKNKGSKFMDMMYFHTAQALVHNKQIDLYIDNNQARFGDLNQYLIARSIDTMNNHIQINAYKHLHMIFSGKEGPFPTDHIHTLNNAEVEVIAEFRLNKNKLDITISFDDGDIPHMMKTKRKLTEDECNNINKVIQNTGFGSFENIKVHNRKTTSGKVNIHKKLEL